MQIVGLILIFLQSSSASHGSISFLEGGPKEKYMPRPVSPTTPIKIASTKEKAGEDVSIEFGAMA